MSRRVKLCVVTTHPIQYVAPWFRELAAESDLELHVVYFREMTAATQAAGFGASFVWDVPLREGYESSILDCGQGIAQLPKLIVRLAAALRRISPDVVLITGWNESGLIAAYPLAALLRLPIVLRGEANNKRARPFWLSSIHRILLKFPKAIVEVGRANRSFYLANGVPAHRVFSGCYFVESGRLVEMCERTRHMWVARRAQMGLTEEDFVFCFVGKHVAFKRPVLLVEAAARLRSAGQRVSLVFAGSGVLTDSLKDRSRELGVPAHFLGFVNQSELWRVYGIADALVLPSTAQESWGLVTNEALLFEKPVILSDEVGCGPDLVSGRGTGYVCAANPESLAEAMGRLLSDPVSAAAMGKRGRALVLNEYSSPTATAGLKVAIAAATA